MNGPDTTGFLSNLFFKNSFGSFFAAANIGSMTCFGTMRVCWITSSSDERILALVEDEAHAPRVRRRMRGVGDFRESDLAEVRPGDTVRQAPVLIGEVERVFHVPAGERLAVAPARRLLEHEIDAVVLHLVRLGEQRLHAAVERVEDEQRLVKQVRAVEADERPGRLPLERIERARRAPLAAADVHAFRSSETPLSEDCSCPQPAEPEHGRGKREERKAEWVGPSSWWVCDRASVEPLGDASVGRGRDSLSRRAPAGPTRAERRLNLRASLVRVMPFGR